MTHTQLIVVKDGKFIKKNYPGIKITFHGKFYITVNNKDYKLQHQPVYAENTDTLLLVCTELQDGEAINNYNEPDSVLATTKEDIDKMMSISPQRYYKYDWDFTPFIESSDDHLGYFLDVSELSEETVKSLPENAGLSVATYLKETGNKSIWKDGTPKYTLGG